MSKTGIKNGLNGHNGNGHNGSYKPIVEYGSNVLLVTTALTTEAPLALGYLSNVFKEEGYGVYTKCNTFREPLKAKDYIQAAKDCNAKIIGLSIVTIQILETYDLLKELQKEGFIVIAGGAHSTDCPEEVVKYGADIVVRGEAEDTLRELCRYWNGTGKSNLKDIFGITYRSKPNLPHTFDEETVLTTPRRARIDLTEVNEMNSVPDITIFDQDLFRQPDGLIKGFHRLYTSRGCPARCTFCDWGTFRQKFSNFDCDTLIADIKYKVENFGIKSFTVTDDCFTVNRHFVDDFCNKISQIRINEGEKIVWRVSTRASIVNPDMLTTMKESGCHLIIFGLESGDPETLKRMKKGISLKQNIKAPWMAKEAGIQCYGSIMCGFPWETPKHLQNTIDYIHEIWDAVYLFHFAGALMPFPGNEIYREYKDEFGFEKYWLDEDFQHKADQIYQNTLNPYAYSTFHQRNLYDDTYIQEQTFFNYDKAYRDKVTEFVFTIGKHNLETLYPQQYFKQKAILAAGHLSSAMYKKFPNLERTIGRWIMTDASEKRSAMERQRDKKRGFVKNPDHSGASVRWDNRYGFREGGSQSPEDDNWVDAHKDKLPGIHRSYNPK